MPITGVIDQHVDSAKTRDGSLYGGKRLGLVGHIQGHCQHALTVLGEDVGQRFDTPAADHHTVTIGQRGLGNGGTKTSGRTGNKPDFVHCIAPVVVQKKPRQL
ncbi:hypothetical protein D3C86_1510480 [compost metagenome]